MAVRRVESLFREKMQLITGEKGDSCPKGLEISALVAIISGEISNGRLYCSQ